MPDLEPTSAQSKSTTQEAITPLHPYGPRGFAAARTSKDSDCFKAKPSLLISSTFVESMSQEVTYEELLSGTEQSDPRFPFYSPHDEVAPSQSASPRSSGSLTNCNSQESIILSRAASVVQSHRSFNSASSLPELVHSGHNSASREDVKRTAAEHKRCISLMKEPSHQSFTKINERIDTASQAAALDRSQSIAHAVAKRTSPFHPTGPAVLRKETVSQKNGPRISSRTSSRGNYSLFPSAAPRSPSKEVTA